VQGRLNVADFADTSLSHQIQIRAHVFHGFGKSLFATVCEPHLVAVDRKYLSDPVPHEACTNHTHLSDSADVCSHLYPPFQAEAPPLLTLSHNHE
jgi:hypothetical protein